MNAVIRFIYVSSFMALASASYADDRFQPDVDSVVVQSLEKARNERRAGHLGQSITQLQHILDIRPDYYLAKYNLALAYADNRQYRDAEKSYIDAVRLSKEKRIVDYSLYNSFGWMYMLSGEFAKAEEQFNVVLAHINEVPTEVGKGKAYNNSGLNYIYLGKYKEAENNLTIAVQRYRNRSAADNLRLLQKVRAQRESMR